MGAFSIWHLLVILVIVLVLFGAKRLRTIGSDLGGAVKGFRESMKEGEETQRSTEADKVTHKATGSVIEGEVTKKEKEHV